MSIRHFTPRRRDRGGAPKSVVVTMAILLGLTILMQVLYPLINGTFLQFVTIASVYTGAFAMFLHGVIYYGARYGWSILAITLPFGFFIEQLGVSIEWPFGEYQYSNTLEAKFLDVPLVVPFAWVMIAHPCLVAARRVGKSWVFLYGGALMMAWDLFLDPLMVSAGRWSWVVEGSHVPFSPEIPLSNTFGWLLSGMALITALHFITPRDRRKSSGSLLGIDIFLLWTLISGVIGNLFFFARPGVAFFAGSILGLLLFPYFFSRWIGRP